MITGTVRLDLSRDSEANDRRSVGSLYGIPSGTRVVLLVGERSFPAIWTVDHFRQYGDALHFDVQGSTAAVQAWVQALRGEDPLQLRRPA